MTWRVFLLYCLDEFVNLWASIFCSVGCFFGFVLWFGGMLAVRVSIGTEKRELGVFRVPVCMRCVCSFVNGFVRSFRVVRARCL